MPSFNKVILIGHLTRDPELINTESNVSICHFGLATTRHYNTKDGERREETAFVDISCFGKQAELVEKYFSKGNPILVEGRLKFEQWETNNGDKRSKLSVILESFQFIGTKKDKEEKPKEDAPQKNTEFPPPPPDLVAQPKLPISEENKPPQSFF